MSTNLIAATKESVWYVIGESLHCFDFKRRSSQVDAQVTDFDSSSIACLAMVGSYQKPWCGTNNGIYYFKGEKWSKLSASGDPPGGSFSCLSFDGEHVLAAANRGLGFLTIGEVFSWKTLYTKEAYGLPNNRINCLIIDKAKHLLCGTKQGLATQDSDRFSNFTTDALTTANILDLAISPTGQVWFIEQTSLRKRNKMGVWETDAGWSAVLPEATLQCLYIDGEGIIYVGTDHGLLACKQDRWECIGGSFSENIRCLFGDPNGIVWCLTTQELLCIENLKALALNELPDFGVLLQEREARRQLEKPSVVSEKSNHGESRDPTFLSEERDATILANGENQMNRGLQPTLKSPPVEKLVSSVVLMVEHPKAKASIKSPGIFRIGIARSNFLSDVQWTLKGLPERAVYGCSTNHNKLTLSVDISQVNLKKLPEKVFSLQLVGQAPGVTIAPIDLELKIENSLPYWVLPTLGFVSVYAVIIGVTASAPVKMLEPAWSADDSIKHASEGGIDLRVMVPEDAEPGAGKLEIYRDGASVDASTFVDVVSDLEHAGLFVYSKRLAEGKYRLVVSLPGYRPLEKLIKKESALVTKADSDTGIGASPLNLERKFLRLF
jgi:hypothetical protein